MRDLSSSRVIYAIKSIVNEYCGILSDGILSGSRKLYRHVPRRGLPIHFFGHFL